MQMTRSVVRASAWPGAGGGSMASAVSLAAASAHGARRSAAAAAAPARRPSRRRRCARRIPPGTARCRARLGDDVDGAGLERLHQRVGAVLGQRRADHHRHRPLRHHLAQEGDAVHARHLDVQHDHVGHFVPGCARAATNGSDAVPITSMSGSRRGSRSASGAPTAESSTISTRIFTGGLIAPAPSEHGVGRPAAAAGRMPAIDSEWPRNRIAAGAQMLAEPLQHRVLRWLVEIDQHVAAEDDVEVAVDRIRPRPSGSAARTHQRAQLGHDPHQLARLCSRPRSR